MQVATDSSYEAAFGTAGSNALVLLLLDLQHYGLLIGQVYFGLWLVPLGYLAYRSGMFPKALGVVLIVAGVCWWGKGPPFAALGTIFTYFAGGETRLQAANGVQNIDYQTQAPSHPLHYLQDDPSLESSFDDSMAFLSCSPHAQPSTLAPSPR